jgi:SOS-response transcriptional repressor LexA
VLTPRQAELLAFLRDYAATHRGVMPCYREMTAALGVSSKGRVSAMLDRLVQCGHLRRQPRRMRGLELIEPGTDGVATLEHAAARLVEERGAEATAALLIELAHRMTPAAIDEQP